MPFTLSFCLSRFPDPALPTLNLSSLCLFKEPLSRFGHITLHPVPSPQINLYQTFVLFAYSGFESQDELTDMGTADAQAYPLKPLPVHLQPHGQSCILHPHQAPAFFSPLPGVLSCAIRTHSAHCHSICCGLGVRSQKKVKKGWMLGVKFPVCKDAVLMCISHISWEELQRESDSVAYNKNYLFQITFSVFLPVLFDFSPSKYHFPNKLPAFE